MLSLITLLFFGLFNCCIISHGHLLANFDVYCVYLATVKLNQAQEKMRQLGDSNAMYIIISQLQDTGFLNKSKVINLELKLHNFIQQHHQEITLSYPCIM